MTGHRLNSAIVLPARPIVLCLIRWMIGSGVIELDFRPIANYVFHPPLSSGVKTPGVFTGLPTSPFTFNRIRRVVRCSFPDSTNP
jgi:hypothetical protein